MSFASAEKRLTAWNPTTNQEEEHPGFAGPCVGCGHDVDHGGFWAENSHLTICLPCAERILPALLADSVIDAAIPGTEHIRMHRALETFTARYWEAVSCALTRRIRLIGKR
jgi:hypothetical protein